VPAFEQLALPAMEDAVLRRRIVVIDEIGKMDFASKLFSDVVEKALDSPAIVMATVMEGPSSLCRSDQAPRGCRYICRHRSNFPSAMESDLDLAAWSGGD